jgi:hypothetical protein
MFCILVIGRKRKKQRENEKAFSPGLDMPCWLCCIDTFWLLGVLKSDLMVSL